MHCILWLIMGGLIGWVASLIMQTGAQPGIVLNVVGGVFRNGRERLLKHQMTRTVLLLPTVAALLALTMPRGLAQANVHPLEPLDRASPRATLASFLAITDDLGRAAAQYVQTPGAATAQIFRSQVSKAIRCFDLSQIAPTARRELGADATVLLWEVLARLALPPMASVPDLAAMEEYIQAGKLARWTIPHTEIQIALIKEGPQAGEYLFSPETVSRLEEFYYRTRALPYQRPMPILQPRQLQLEYGGVLVPPSFTNAMPAWLKLVVFDQVVWKWCATILVLALTMWCLWGIQRWSGRVSQKHSAAQLLRPLVAPMAALILISLANLLTRSAISVTGIAAEWVQYILPAMTYLAVAWLAWLLAIFVAEVIIASPHIPDQSLDAHLLRLLARVVGLSVIIVVLFWGGNRLGLPLYGLIAGVSVGGLAIALAAQGTLENFLGSINLFTDRPVRVGDLCQYGDKVGIVEEIGLRSTRVRGRDRTVTTIPNADFSKMQITNFSRRDRMLLSTVLSLRYETTPDQLRHVVAKLRELLIAHPRVLKDPLRVRFVGFGDVALHLEVYVYVQTQDHNEFLGIQEDLFLRMMSIVENSGTGFAFPSQTLYLARDGGLDAQRGKAAEQEVQAWRAQQELPFPDFRPEVIERIRDTLDFPPAGSPNADGRVPVSWDNSRGVNTRDNAPIST